jgi:hypothetical protein
MAFAGPVFVCHATADRPLAVAAARELENAGVECWIAPRDVPEGADWIDSIVQALTGADCLVLISSRNAEASPHVLRELEQAVHQRLPIVAVRTAADEPDPRHRYLIGPSQRVSSVQALPAAVTEAKAGRLATHRRSRRLLVAAALLVVAVMAGLLVIGTQTWWAKDDSSGATSAPGLELAEDSNPRFGFRFSYPAVWTREDPANGDGNIYRDPRLDADVELVVYGSFADADADTQDLEATMLAYESDYELIDSRPAGLHLWESSTGADGQLVDTRTQIPGHRILFRTVRPDGKEIVQFRQMAVAPGRTITIAATLPSDLLPEYEDVLNDVAASLRAVSPWTG